MPAHTQHPQHSRTAWSAIAATAAIQLAVLFALTVAVVGYLSWSSDAAMAEFMATTKAPAAVDQGFTPHASFPAHPVHGRGLCPKRA